MNIFKCIKTNFSIFIYVFILMSLFLASCSSSVIELSEQGQEVVLLPNPEKYPGCIAIETIQATALVSTNNSYQQAMNKMKNKAAALGVTHLTIDHAKTRSMVTKIAARGYKCIHLITTQETPLETPDTWIFVDE